MTVRVKPSSNPEIVRFETNRPLTGMGHERYRSIEDVVRDRPIDRLARYLFTNGGVESVHANGSMVTVHLAGGATGVGMDQIVTDLFRYYGVERPYDTEAVPADEVPVDDAPADAPVDAAPAESAPADAG